jgi:hypothetical protein
MARRYCWPARRVVLAAASIGADAIDAVFVDLKPPTRSAATPLRARGARIPRQDGDPPGSDRDHQ